MIVFLYGPPGSGKSTLGRRLAQAWEVPFLDLDEQIVASAGQTIPEIFAAVGEAGFRQQEKASLVKLAAAAGHAAVVSLGGGALLDPANRALVESLGRVVCLSAPLEVLADRLQSARESRPLLAGDQTGKLSQLLAQRSEHYASFPLRLSTAGASLDACVWEAQTLTGWFHITGMGQPYDVRVQPGSLDQLGSELQALNLKGPLALVTDTRVGPLYQSQVQQALAAAGYTCHVIQIPAGEAYKTIDTLGQLWAHFLAAGLDRGSTVIALGGGVVGDLAGFAAATYLRGIPWVALPTTLLAMCDASLGGKTGADLPQGKNLVGAFHPPRLVLSDPRTLQSLPQAELRSGLAEVVKHGILGDPALFALCQQGWPVLQADWDQVVRRAIAVKARVILADPFERGLRATLNLGHTLGHAVELASDFKLRHGEAVAIGLVAAAQFAEWHGLADSGLADRFRTLLTGLGLPVQAPAGLDRSRIMHALHLDKKRSAGNVRFVLPRQVGDVQPGWTVPDEWIDRFLNL